VKRSEAAELVALLVGAYPRGGITEATCAVYETQLTDLTYEAASAAVGKLLRSSRFMPTIAEIREAAAALELGDVRPGAEAWGDVLQAIRKVGSYGMPRFADPIVEQCVRSLGWRNLCLDGHNDAADRAKFCELYDRLAQRQRVDVVAGEPALLPGPVRKLLTSSGVGRELAAPRKTDPAQARAGLAAFEKAERSS
jgi:hypothetical protein